MLRFSKYSSNLPGQSSIVSETVLGHLPPEAFQVKSIILFEITQSLKWSLNKPSSTQCNRHLTKLTKQDRILKVEEQ